MRLMPPYTLVAALGAAFLVANTTAVAPPHPNNTRWESATARRRRLNIRNDFEPTHVTAEHCRHMTEEQCRTDDQAVSASKEQRRLSSTGNNIKVLVLLCRFSDHVNRVLPQRDYFEELFNGKGTSDVNPVGSIREWLYSNSIGRYNGKSKRVIFSCRSTANSVSYLPRDVSLDALILRTLQSPLMYKIGRPPTIRKPTMRGACRVCVGPR